MSAVNISFYFQEYETGVEQMKVEQIKQQGEERRKHMQQDAKIKKEVREQWSTLTLASFRACQQFSIFCEGCVQWN